MSAQSLHVAAAQIETVLGDIDANLRKHLDTIDAARAAGIDFLLFPELSLTGHGAGRESARLAIDRDHSLVAMLARASGPMLTMFGAIERTDSGFFNAAISVRDGAVVHVHRKINLATYGKLDDGLHFVAGTKVDTFDLASAFDPRPMLDIVPALDTVAAFDTTPGCGIAPRWRVAPMICADTWNPPLVHLAAAQGAALMPIAVSSALEAVGAEFDNPSGWGINLRFHALTYGMAIVMANRVGQETGLTFWGGSRIVGPDGHELAIAADNEMLLEASIEHLAIERARQMLPTIRDANHALLSSEFQRVGRMREAAR